MAKAGRNVGRRARPHLAAAFFCERVLQEKDGVHSAIRIVDILKLMPPPDMPKGAKGDPPCEYVAPIIAFLAVKSGDARGEHTLRLDLVYPSGRRLKTQELKIHLLGDENGVNVSAQVLVPIQDAGLYWYDVFLDDELITRMPLRIAHQQATEAEKEPESEAKGDK